MDANHSFAATKLYDASGAQITVSWQLETDAGVIDIGTANGIRESIGNLLTAGFSVNVPGLNAGQKLEAVGAVSRREKADGTPIIDLFAASEALQWKLLSLYFDTDDEIAAFETATGLKLKQIPLYASDGAIKRDSPRAAQYIVKVARPTEIVMEANPFYNPDEQDISKRKPKHVFAGWKSDTPRPTSPTSPSSTPPAPAANGASGKDPLREMSDELFDTLWQQNKRFFKARAHFNNWAQGHDVYAMGLEKVAEHIRFSHWYADQETAQAYYSSRAARFNMDATDITEALANAMGKPVKGFRVSVGWHGDEAEADAALLAWKGGYAEDTIMASAGLLGISDYEPAVAIARRYMANRPADVKFGEV